SFWLLRRVHLLRGVVGVEREVVRLLDLDEVRAERLVPINLSNELLNRHLWLSSIVLTVRHTRSTDWGIERREELRKRCGSGVFETLEPKLSGELQIVLVFDNIEVGRVKIEIVAPPSSYDIGRSGKQRRQLLML